MNEKEVLEKISQDKVKFVHLQFTDLHGMVKAVTIPVEKLNESFAKGTWFDGSSIEGFTRICESDMFLKPDPETYAVIPWENSGKVTARLICDVFMPDGKPFEGDPRYILKKVVKEAADLGYKFYVGPELEFFLFKFDADGNATTNTHDTAAYFDYPPRDLASDIRKEITLALEMMGMEVEASHHEVAPGQHEIDFKYGDAVTQADRCITFKHAVKSIAYKNGKWASFMPKPIFGQNGSGMHVHQSLFDIKTGENIFYDKNDKYCLSKVAKSFIAGQMKHVQSFCAVTAPTVNSYKRLVPGYEAPVYICWAQRNRSALIRIPRISPGREKATRAELRCPDPSSNPYLAFAVMLKAGLDGIKNKLEPPMPVEEDVYEFDPAERLKHHIDTLPGSLGDAIEELKKDKLIADVLGAHTYKMYINAKTAEWDEYRIQVSEWEKSKYFYTL